MGDTGLDKRASADDVASLRESNDSSSASPILERPASVVSGDPAQLRKGFFNARVMDPRNEKRLSLTSPIGSYRLMPKAETLSSPLSSSVSLPDASIAGAGGTFIEKSSRTEASTSPTFATASPSSTSRPGFGSLRGSRGSTIRPAVSGAATTVSAVATVPYEQKLEDEIALGGLTSRAENKICADCSAPNPRWISITYGTWICSACAAVLKEVVGKAVANVQCLDFAWHYFGPEVVKALDFLGNKRANERLELNLTLPKPTPTSDVATKAAWMKAKYDEGLQSLTFSGYLNVAVAVRNSKKKLQWDRRFLRFHDNIIDIFLKEEDKDPMETIEMAMCGYKEFHEMDSWTITTKDTKIDSKLLFEVITPKKFFVFHASAANELYDWVQTLKLSSSAMRTETRKDDVNPSLLSMSHSDLSEAAVTTGGTKNPKLASDALKELLTKSLEEREKERIQLRARLSELTANLEEKMKARDEVVKRIEATDTQSSELEAQKRRIQLRICQLEPESQIIQKTVVVQEEDSSKIGGGLILQDDGSIKGGTVSKLLAAVTHEGSTDTENLQAFLLTYRSFTTPSDFLEKLRARFQIQPPPYIDEETLNKFVTTRQRPIRLKVVNVLKSWINHHYYDFELDSNLVLSLISFLDEVIEPAGMATTSEQLKRLLKKQIKGKTKNHEIMLDQSSIPAPILPPDLNNWTFLDIDPLEAARQLCLVEQELYRAIRPRECLNQAWNHKTQKETAAPNVLAMIRRFNRVSSWVTTTVVKKDTVEERSKVLQRMIVIAQHCRELHNYNAVQEILSGLSASPCHRLKHTWAALDQKTNQTLANLRKDLSNDCNFQSLRNVLKTESSPAIPYLGMYLTDLTFIEDGNPDMLQGGLINFAKRRRIAGVIREIQQYQNAPYHLEVVKPIFDWLKDIEGLDDAQAYALSLAAEPKEIKPS